MTEDDASGEAYALKSSTGHLLRRAHQRVAEVFAAHAPSQDLTLRQFEVVQALFERDAVSQSDLVRTTGIDRSTMAEMIKRLEEKGFIARKPKDQSSGSRTVILTQAGRAALESFRPAAQAADKAMMTSLKKSERAVLLRALMKSVYRGTGQGETSPEAAALKKAKPEPKKKKHKKSKKQKA
jgi:DNA-binding MarR family transcriptional regulator